MKDDLTELERQQHFPTYIFRHRDIALEEYKTAAKNMESEERVFINASNIAIIVAAGLGSLAVGSLEKLTQQFDKIIPATLTLCVLLFLTIGFSIVTLRYFADRQKAVTFAARKVIVLRIMLGLSYGTIQLVLPNWRVEGGDEPFSVRLFPGWNTFIAYPYFTIAGISSAVIFFLLAAFFQQRDFLPFLVVIPPWEIIILLTVSWGLFLAYVYRKALLDIHETPFLLLIQNISNVIRLKLVTNFEYIIYRATLARYEQNRFQINLTNLKKMLVFIEDRTFFKHYGLSLRSMLRALLSMMKLKRRSGGSTITQQLVRTLFIKDTTKLYRRKMIEIFLALWLNRVFPKNEQLDLYLASVRFERGVYGILEAMKYFWGRMISNPSFAQSFFLIERVSNIHSQFLTDKIIQTVNSAIKSDLMTINDVYELYNLYKDAISQKRIVDRNCGIERMARSFDIPQ